MSHDSHTFGGYDPRRPKRDSMAMLSNFSVIFDLDGTLVDTAPDLVRVLNLVLVEEGHEPVPFEAVCEIVGQGALAMIRRSLDRHGVSIDETELRRLLPRFLELYSADITAHSAPYDGVVRALDTLAAEGAILGVCTNKYEYLSVQLLQELGLADRFAAIIGPDTLDVRKPDPAHITGTLERMGGRADRAVMIGDSTNDVNAAKAAGIPSIVVSFGYLDVPAHEMGADRVIDHFDELVPAIHEIAGVAAQS